MNTTTVSLKPILLTAAAAILCTGLQFSGIDTLAAPRSAAIETRIVQLPKVWVVAPREAAVAANVQRLPQVVVVGRRLDRAPGTAQALGTAPGSAT